MQTVSQITLLCQVYGIMKKDLAEALGIRPETFSRILHGKRQFSKLQKEKINDMYNAMEKNNGH